MSSRTLSLIFQNFAGATRRDVGVSQMILAGWTGRDPIALEKHMAELESVGVRRPASTPIFYRASAARLTTGDTIEVVGAESSGEVEFVLLQSGGSLWVGVGSDHTDRKVETYSVTVSKQMCDKPIADSFWAYESVASHWDRLVLRSHIVENGRTVLYQEGSVSSMLSPPELLSRFGGEARLSENTLMFCGTLAARGGIRAADQFESELYDPVLERTIRHAYKVVSLPILG